MKKYLLILLLAIFIIPSIAFASWWNPFSWFSGWTFHKTEIAPQIPVETQKTSEEKINELQKQLDELKNQKQNPSSTTITPKPKEIKKVAPVVVTPIVVTPEIIKIDTSVCDKKKDTLTQLTSELNLITQETSSIYSDYRDAKSSQNTTQGVQDFNYLYNKMLSNSSGFYGKIDQLQIDTAGLNTVLSGADLVDIRLNLNNGGNTFKQAFNLMMQAFKYAGVDKTNDANLNNAITTINDSGVKERAAVTYFFQATSKMEIIKKTLSDELTKENCQ